MLFSFLVERVLADLNTVFKIIHATPRINLAGINPGIAAFNNHTFGDFAGGIVLRNFRYALWVFFHEVVYNFFARLCGGVITTATVFGFNALSHSPIRCFG